MGTTGGFESSLSFLLRVLTDYSSTSGVALLLWVGMFVLGLATCDHKRIALVAPWMGAPFVFLSVVQSGVRSKPRYVLFILPLCLLVMARGMTAVSRWLIRSLGGMKRDRTRLAVLASALIALILGSFSVASVTDYYDAQKENWRAAAEYLQRNMSEGDIVVVDGRFYRRGGDRQRARYCLQYYLGTLGLEGKPVLAVKRGFAAKLSDVDEDRGQVWAALWYPDRPLSWDTMDRIEVIDFTDVSLIRLRDPLEDVLTMSRLTYVNRLPEKQSCVTLVV